MTIDFSKLTAFGWSTYFSSQLDADDLASFIPVRVAEVHRSQIRVIGPSIDELIPPFCSAAEDEESHATVGDWLLLSSENRQAKRLLDRKSLFKRRAAGTGRKVQLIGANVDTLFVVSSCNQDFNPARMERYLALAQEAEVAPVVILTKADLVESTTPFVREAEKLLPGLVVEGLDARSKESAACLMDWCSAGQTVAFVGSSGVGKSTLINSLLGSQVVKTQDIREDDDKGRHTTSGRALYRVPGGGWLLDTPGMRELQLVDVHSGLEEVFSDVASLASQCRFADCRHNDEPGCAVQAAITNGSLEPRRLKSWRKLAAEEVFNTETLAERRQRGREFSKMVRRVKDAKDQSRES